MNLNVMKEVVEILNRERPHWRASLEYPAFIALDLYMVGGIRRVLNWGGSNDTWGADVNVERDNMIDQCDPAEIIQCLATDISSRSGNAKLIARHIVREVDAYKAVFEHLSTVDLYKLCDAAFDATMNAIRAGNTDAAQISGEVTFAPVLKAFPAIYTGDLEPGLTVQLDREIEAVIANDYAETVTLREVVGEAVIAWLRSNIYSSFNYAD